MYSIYLPESAVVSCCLCYHSSLLCRRVVIYPPPLPVFADTLYIFSEWFSLSRLHPRRIAVLLPPAAAEPVAGPSTGKTEFDHPILFILYFICFCTPGCGLCCFCTPGCGLCCFCTPVCGLCCIIVHCFLFPSSRNTRHPAVVHSRLRALLFGLHFP